MMNRNQEPANNRTTMRVDNPYSTYNALYEDMEKLKKLELASLVKKCPLAEGIAELKGSIQKLNKQLDAKLRAHKKNEENVMDLAIKELGISLREALANEEKLNAKMNSIHIQMDRSFQAHIKDTKCQISDLTKKISQLEKMTLSYNEEAEELVNNHYKKRLKQEAAKFQAFKDLYRIKDREEKRTLVRVLARQNADLMKLPKELTKKSSALQNKTREKMKQINNPKKSIFSPPTKSLRNGGGGAKTDTPTLKRARQGP